MAENATLRDFKLDDDFDLALEDNEVPMVECQYAAAQALRVALQINTGEWALDIRVGVPYREQILVKPVNIGVASGLIIAAALASEGILRLRSYEPDLDTQTREFTMEMNLQTVWCDVTVAVEPVSMLGLIMVTILGPAGPF